MQRKLVLGIISIGLLSLLLALATFSTQLKPSHPQFTQATQIENGANLYAHKCQSCHSDYDEPCLDANNNEIACSGSQLFNTFLLCDGTPRKLNDVSFKHNLEKSISQSIVNTHIGISLQQSNFSTQLTPTQKQQIAAYLVSYVDCLCTQAPSLSFPWPNRVEDFFGLRIEYDDPCREKTTVTEINSGNLRRGEEVYVEYACHACHGTMDLPDSATIGPWLGNIAQDAGTRVEDISAWQYVYDSILYPNDFIAPKCPHTKGECLDPSLMAGDYRTRIAPDPQNLADLLAFLMNEPKP